MKKKTIMFMLLLALVTLVFTGCQKDSAPSNTPQTAQEPCSLCEQNILCQSYTVDGVDYYVCDDCYGEFETGMLGDSDEEEPLEFCSLCEVAKECGTYTVDGQDYLVCDDCYNEFETGMGLQ